MLHITRPIIFFDIESTGLSVTHDRIIEVAFLKVFPDGKEESRTYLVNPTVPIPAESSEFHHIFDKDVADKPSFAECAKEMYEFILGCDLAGFNLLKFDVPILIEEFARVDIHYDIDELSMIDVQLIYHKMEPRTLSAAYKFYCKENLENAHTALADAKATLDVFKAQLTTYSDLPTNVKEMALFAGIGNRVDLEGRVIRNDAGEEVFNFGKHKGKKVEDVFTFEPSYYNWIMEGDFAAHTKKSVEKIKLRMLLNKFNK